MHLQFYGVNQQSPRQLVGPAIEQFDDLPNIGVSKILGALSHNITAQPMSYLWEEGLEGAAELERSM